MSLLNPLEATRGIGHPLSPLPPAATPAPKQAQQQTASATANPFAAQKKDAVEQTHTLPANPDPQQLWQLWEQTEAALNELLPPSLAYALFEELHSNNERNLAADLELAGAKAPAFLKTILQHIQLYQKTYIVNEDLHDAHFKFTENFKDSQANQLKKLEQLHNALVNLKTKLDTDEDVRFFRSIDDKKSLESALIGIFITALIVAIMVGAVCLSASLNVFAIVMYCVGLVTVFPTAAGTAYWSLGYWKRDSRLARVEAEVTELFRYSSSDTFKSGSEAEKAFSPESKKDFEQFCEDFHNATRPLLKKTDRLILLKLFQTYLVDLRKDSALTSTNYHEKEFHPSKPV